MRVLFRHRHLGYHIFPGYPKCCTSLLNPRGELVNDEEKSTWVAYRLKYINDVFTHTPQAINIIRSAQWYFDSYCGDDELLSYIQATVALEILLGDKKISKKTGLSELLGNRCAYLISKSNKERESILNDFRAIYEIRSQIVHNGMNRLNIKERIFLDKLHKLCRRTINKEIELLNDVEL